MPACSVLECKNRSIKANLHKGGVSYHSFPRNADIKEKWIEATGRLNWMPSKFSKICSEHFDNKDVMITKKGLRYLKPTAIPIKKIMNYVDVTLQKDDSSEAIPGSSKKRDIDTIETISETIIKKSRIDEITPCSTTHSTPRKRKMCGIIRWMQYKVKKKDLKIKRLQAQGRRLKMKLRSVGELLKILEKNFAVANENLTSLKNTNVKIDELISRMQSGVTSKRKYSPALRSFALTLHYYSPKAYDYVRSTFNTCLPHPRTLKLWYAKVGGEPGFTKESFRALKMKADSSSYPIIATLVIDEMSIRRRIEWDGHKLHGYIDMGTGLDGDHLAEAKEALVFLVTAINANFKVPVAFFLVNGVSGEQRAELIKQCIEMIHDVGIRIVALTFDGCAANISMAGHLGCCFQEGNITFKHPVTQESIVTVLDPCHMIKLLRNAFESYKIFIDKDGNKINWQYLIELNNLQYNETFHLSNKLRDRHINFQNERMKVKLATQIFSLSVAEAMKFCRNDLGIETFNDSEATEKFLIICNNIFDIFNSRSLHFYGYKKALNKNNANEIFEFLNLATIYLNNLKMENGILVKRSPRKTGFIGFLGCIKALKHLYASLIESNILKYLPFYKLSQDHLELLFCNIRSHGGSNNNPTARQFVAAYKKILVHVELKDTDKGNCSALEQLSILNCSSAVERINKSTTHTQYETQEEQKKEELELEEDIFESLSEFGNQAITYIAGHIIRVLIKKIHCNICVGALITKEKQNIHKFIVAKDKGGLLYPSNDVIITCRTTEIFLKSVVGGVRKDVIISKILHQFIGTKLFDNISYHQLNQFPASNHVTDLIKAIVERYINVRMHHLLKLKLRLSKRQLLNKYVLFQGQ